MGFARLRRDRFQGYSMKEKINILPKKRIEILTKKEFNLSFIKEV
jgi:hypothetical protein